MKFVWVEPDIRYTVVDFAGICSDKTEITFARLIYGLELLRANFIIGVNEHNL